MAFGFFFAEERRAKEPIIPLRLFSNKVFAIASAMGFLAGSLSYGAQQFLPLQFQDANLLSPTKAGLWLSPIMGGIMIGSAVGGRLIAATGRYKIFPIIGSVCAVLGVIFISRMGSTTQFYWLVLPMLGIGIGNGSTFTTTSIATQNAIDVADIGVGTATLVSLRSLGGSISLAMYGTLFTARVTASLRGESGAAGKVKEVSSLVREPAKIKALDPELRAAVARAVTAGTNRVFLVAIPLALLGLVLGVLLPEYPLRTTAAPAAPEGV